MGRDLGKPKKSQTSTGMFAGLTRAPAGLPMKQIFTVLDPMGACIRQRPHRTAPVRQGTRTAASSNAHDRDGTFNKEIYP
jgi:hypothetical protein